VSSLITPCRILTKSCSRLAEQAEAKIPGTKLEETRPIEAV